MDDVPGDTSEDSGFEDSTYGNCLEIMSEISAADVVQNDIKLAGSGQTLYHDKTPCDVCRKDSPLSRI